MTSAANKQVTESGSLRPLRGAVVSALVTGVVTVAEAFGAAATAHLVLAGAAAVAFGVGAFQLLNSLYRPFFCGHWSAEVGARRLLIFELALGVVLAAGGWVGMGMTGDDPPIWAPAAIFGLAAPLYFQAEIAITRKVRAARKKTGTERFADSKLLGWLGSDVTVSDSLDVLRKNAVGRFVTDLFGNADDGGTATLSITRLKLAEALVLAAAFAFAALVGGAGGTIVREQRERGEASGAEEAVEEPVEPRHSEVALAGAAAGTWAIAVGSQPQAAEQDGSEEDCVPALPGPGVPGWAEQQLYEAFYGDGGPGDEEGGCPGPSIAPDKAFAYVLGLAPDGTLKSVAVASRRWGKGIFLAPAATVVLTLVSSGVPAGGPPRRDRGGGDFYLVYTSAGTTALVRQRKAPPGRPEDAEPYVRLPPVVAELWYAEMTRRGHWLWPRLRDAGPAGTTTFDLLAVGGRWVKRLRYDHASRQAWPVTRGEPKPRAASGTEISDAAVLEVPYP